MKVTILVIVSFLFVLVVWATHGYISREISIRLKMKEDLDASDFGNAIGKRSRRQIVQGVIAFLLFALASLFVMLTIRGLGGA